jgi:hypothetical protein
VREKRREKRTDEVSPFFVNSQGPGGQQSIVIKHEIHLIKSCGHFSPNPKGKGGPKYDRKKPGN